MSFAGSGADDQSEDGELRHSPSDAKTRQEEMLDFSLSDEDVDTADSLDIKPPQASSRVPRNSRIKRRERREGRPRHARSERHREHYRAEKHHRERTRDRNRPEYHRDMYTHVAGAAAGSSTQIHKYELVAIPARYERKYKYDDKRLKSVADQTLDDLRERLLDKKRLKDASEDYSRRRRVESSGEHDAEMYVKEIIDLSHKNDDEKDPESEEQVLRREKLLQADREIARQKEQYQLERERRHQRRLERQEAKRKLLEEQQKEEKRNKRLRMSGELGQYKDKDLSVVTVSDGSSSRSNSPPGSTSTEKTSTDEEEEDAEQPAEEDDHDHVSENESQWKENDTEVNENDAEVNENAPEVPENDPEVDDPEVVEPEVTKVLDDDLPPYFPAIQGCRSVEEFQCLNRIEEGTYGVVYRARDKRTEEIVALKRLKMEKEKEGFPITSLREINTLLKGQHPNIVTVREIVVGSNMDKIFIVMDYVEHDLKSLMETMRNRRQVFVPGEVKCLLKQLLGAVAHLHDNWILHRDLKTSNLLLSHKGILKVGDFGLAREYGSPLKAYTPIVVTLWYRAPELLLCAKEYSTPVDIWSVGCIFAELLLMNALFPGKSEVDQLNRIFKELGTPNDRIWPNWPQLPAVKKMKFTEYPGASLQNKFSMLSEAGLALLKRLLTYDPQQRTTAEDAVHHAWFSEAPLPIDPAMFPTWPAKSELGRKALQSPKPPSGGKEYKQLGDADEDSALGFHMGTTNASSSLMEARRLAMGAGFSLKF